MPAAERTIPELVRELFYEKYPDVLIKSWYITHLVYWENDISSDWYNGWYHERSVIVYRYEKPNYFEVEFVDQPGEVSRAIYNKYGYWYETRTRIKGLTAEIYDALQDSKYRDWKISPMMERIESTAWPEIIYRFNVSKGMRSAIIRMDAEGNFIQIKSTNEL